MLQPLLAAVLTLASGFGPVRPPRSPSPEVRLKVEIDSAHHQIVITSGPFFLPNMPPMEDHGMMDMGASHDTPVQRFEWPVDGWFRGFHLEVRDADGKQLPRHIMHHMIMVNYDRRQLLYPAAERLMGAGKETDDATIPATIGIPLRPGTNLGFYIAWHNDTGKNLDGVYLRMVFHYLPKNQNPRPKDVLPIYMDVNLTIGGTNTFDVPADHSTKTYEFTVPTGGRLLGLGGHLHDYGTMVRLEDAETGKEMARVVASRDAAGHILKMSRRLPGVGGAGIRLRADHKYRVVAVYDNPTGENIKNGAMASIVGIFAPDNLAGWPKMDPADPTIQRDLASLDERGQPMEDMDHMDMEHMQHDHQ